MTLQLFPLPTRAPRAKRRVLAHIEDCGSFPDGRECGSFVCARCGYRTGWIYATRREQRRGVSCPTCNPADADAAA